MNASSLNLATDLSERLAAVAPNGLSVRSSARSIEVFSGGRLVGGSPALDIIDEDDGRTLQEKIETAIRAVMSGIQDVIAEDTHEPWPASAGSASGFPEPGCRVAGDQVRVWLGDEAEPALDLSPIALR